METLSPRKSAVVISHFPAIRDTVKRPLRVEMRIVSLMSTSRQRLEHVDAAGLAHDVGEACAVADDLPIDEDRHVLAQCGLVIEHIARACGCSAKALSRTARTVRPTTSASGQKTWRWMFAVKTILAIGCARRGQAQSGDGRSRLPTSRA